MAGGEGAGPRGSEKCRHPRVETELRVTFVFAGDGKHPPRSAVTRNISHGGACLAVDACSPALLAKLTELPLLDLAIEMAPNASFRARVEWVRQFPGPGGKTLVGLEFQSLSAEEETAIIDLIAQALIGLSLPEDAASQEALLPTR